MNGVSVMRMVLAFAACAMMLVPGAAKAAGDEGLYDPLPPAGSAFVRFFNAAKGDAAVAPSLNGKAYDELKAKDASAYFVAKGGDTEIKFGDASAKQALEAGAFYTVVLAGEGKDVKVLKDSVSENRSKAQINFYNLTGAAATLSAKLGEKVVPVVETKADGETGMREINPVPVTLSVMKGETLVKELPSSILERGRAYAVFAVGDDAVWVESRTDVKK